MLGLFNKHMERTGGRI